MLLEYLHSRPLLRFAMLMIGGIALGGMYDAPFLYKLSGIGIIVLTGLILLLRKKELLSSVMISLAAVTLGLFLMANSRTRGDSAVVSLYTQHVQTWMEQQRDRLTTIYQEQGISGDEYAVLTAMTLGEKHNVGKELKEVYSKSGAAHVFALSGMHLGILFMLLTLVLPVKRFPKTCAVAEITVLWMFVMLVGCSASIIRAAVMLTIYCLCKTLARWTESFSVLTLTGTLLLVISPQWLFDIGFQMSFLAVLSIVLLYPPLYRLLPRPGYDMRLSRKALRKAISYVYGILLISLVAQVGVAPLIAHYFGRFSVFFLLTNIIVSPCALLIITLALVLFLLVAMVTPLGMPALFSMMIKGVVFLLVNITHGMNCYLTWISSLPYSSIDGIRLNTPQTILVYTIISSILLLLYLLTRKRSMLDRKEF